MTGDGGIDASDHSDGCEQKTNKHWFLWSACKLFQMRGVAQNMALVNENMVAIVSRLSISVAFIF